MQNSERKKSSLTHQGLFGSLSSERPSSFDSAKVMQTSAMESLTFKLPSAALLIPSECK